MVSPEKVRCQPLSKTQLLTRGSQRAEVAKMRRWRVKVCGIELEDGEVGEGVCARR